MRGRMSESGDQERPMPPEELSRNGGAEGLFFFGQMRSGGPVLAELYRPVHERVEAVNRQYPDLSVRMTADTLGPLEELPAVVYTREGRLELGGWRLVSFDAKKTGDEHLALIHGELIGPEEKLLVRVHSSMMLNEIFGISVSDDRDQLFEAMRRIKARGRGLVIYINQEGAGNRLATAVAQMVLTNQGVPMTQAFEQLGVSKDNRSFEIAADVLTMLGLRGQPLELMTSNVRKAEALREAGFEAVPEEIRVDTEGSEVIQKYLASKTDEGIYYPGKGGETDDNARGGKGE